MADSKVAPLDASTFEILQNRLREHCERLDQGSSALNERRKKVYGSVPMALRATESLITEHNCVPADLVAIQNHLIFGFNVRMGLKTETLLEDVFSVSTWMEDRLEPASLDFIGDGRFQADFKSLYKYYKGTTFSKFSIIGPCLFMVFRVGPSVQDIKTFKWAIEEERLVYLDNRSDHEYTFPNPFEFTWLKTSRDWHRRGPHPHVSIEDRVFVETVGGDLTVKVEDNTEDGSGIYAEPVEHADQSLDDADIFYARVGHLILLKIRPFQEKAFRYLIFNEKLKTVHRADGMADCCVLLPSDAGLVFANGMYLLSGQVVQFETQVAGLTFEKKVNAPNGEDFLYVFYQRSQGLYVLMAYNAIEQSMRPPILCHGYSVFPDGSLLFMRADEEAQKHHHLQVWTTPFSKRVAADRSHNDAFIEKVGNRDLVRALAECQELVRVVRDGQLYASYFADLTKRVNSCQETFHWLRDPQAQVIQEPLNQIKSTSHEAIEAYDKVLQYQNDAEKSLKQLALQAQTALDQAKRAPFAQLSDYLKGLADLRRTRGSCETLREKPYLNLETLENWAAQVSVGIQNLSEHLVQFLQTDAALSPFEKQIELMDGQISEVRRTAQSKPIEADIRQTSHDLELLLDVLNGLPFGDPVQISAILDRLSALFRKTNQTQAKLNKLTKQLGEAENEQAFIAQINLLQQNQAHLLDLSEDRPSCEANLNKLLLQMEEMEARFAEQERFLLQLADLRYDISSAFENKMQQLDNQRLKRVNNLEKATLRVLEGIRKRAEQFQSEAELQTFFGSDLMIEKVRSSSQQLVAWGETSRAESLLSQLKAAQSEALRQMRDRSDLFASENTIQLGRHRFAVQSRSLDANLVLRDGSWGLQLSGSQYFEPVDAGRLEPYREVWLWNSAVDNPVVDAGSILAFTLWQEQKLNPDAPLAFASPEEGLVWVQERLNQLREPGYIKGVHDIDAARILEQLRQKSGSLGILRYSTYSRGKARLIWNHSIAQRDRLRLTHLLESFAPLRRIQPQSLPTYPIQMASQILQQADPQASSAMAEYVCETLNSPHWWEVGSESFELFHSFRQHLHQSGALADFEQAIKQLTGDVEGQEALCRAWLDSWRAERTIDSTECIAMLLQPDAKTWLATAHSGQLVVDGLNGDHPTLAQGQLRLAFAEWFERLHHYHNVLLPQFKAFSGLKKEILAEELAKLKLDRFRPRVLSSFVRNQLIDQVYLPLIGDNMAKQIGASGKEKRTDLMGLLLLVSPPGYGKTTLMEYIAMRLGLIFVKVNGPSIGHAVTSLDPAEAPNASAREELEKLNFGLRLGDNVMLYLDDIQHCNPELLQKFIALCDAQRKIEGVWRGQPVSYDLRGRKFCVVMAGNPYTESGERFQIPDMLANRADTYNLGEVIGDRQEAFARSYLENCMTSNPHLGRLAQTAPADIHPLIEVAQGKRSLSEMELKGDYSDTYLEDAVKVLAKLMPIRDRLLQVNQAYMASAAQADAYRTEPAFKLQGSYRNMNKLAEKILPITNEIELERLVQDHYNNEAQTLARGAEANLLKFRELMAWLTPDQQKRWQDIKKTYDRNQLFRADEDRMSQVLVQLSLFQEGLGQISETISQVGKYQVSAHVKQASHSETIQAQFAPDQWQHIVSVLDQLRPKPEALFAVDETGLPHAFLNRHGFSIVNLGASQFEVRRDKGPKIVLNARGTHLRFELDLGSIADGESEQTVSQLKGLNRRIFPVIFRAKTVEGGYGLSLSVKIEKADMNGMKWLAIFDAFEHAAHQADTILNANLP
ncbi:MAG: DNA repair ATPase [Acidobacteria bacterium]|nr:DNA repair ATPase [Acidobacteriota bacterium]